MPTPYYWPPKMEPGKPCPKCGTVGPSVRFCKDVACAPAGHSVLEHIHRACSVCSVQWLERPLDAPDEAPAPQPDPETLDQYLKRVAVEAK